MEADDDACRAEIPPMLTPEQREALLYEPRCCQRWGERQGADTPPLLAPEGVQEFLTEFAWLKETELALQCLFDGEFDVPKAAKLLQAARRKRHKAKRDREERLPLEGFKNAIETYGKRFHLVQRALGEKVITREVVSKFYLWKRTTEFREWRLRQTAKKTKTKKKKEVERLRQWDDEDEDLETETFLGYHNGSCEVCATGGKLLCCDGCARAYHFSCVQPPIMKVPAKGEDWFCSYCQQAFGGLTPKMVASDENEYCHVYARFPGVPRTLAEAVTDADSVEEDEDELDSDVEDDEEDADSESNDEHDGNTSDFPSAEELSPSSGNTRTDTDDESDSTSAKTPTSSPGADRSKKYGKLRQNPEMEAPPALKPQTGTAVPHSRAASRAPSPIRTTVRSIDSSPAEVRRTPPVPAERPGSGRKRQRKTLVPRRIPPSRFDS